MRFFALGSLVLASLAVQIPTVLHAQFQETTKEELQMTEDAKAPGAAAVFLDVKEVTDDPLHYRMFYARVKVLKEKGKELATVEIPYERGNYKVTDIHGRTIHPDGTVIPLQGKPEDLLIAKNGDEQYNRKVFTLPSVEVGSILEYTYQIRYDDNHFSSPFWNIQREYYVHKAHYAFTPFKAFLNGSENTTSQFLTDSRGNVVHSLIWTSILPPGAKIVTDAVGRYSLDVADVPAIPDEEWMPPLESVRYHLLFYYESASNGKDFWVTEAKRWSKDVDHFAEPTKTLQEAVAGLVAPGDNDLDKARKLYKAVQALDNTDFSRAKGQAELKQLGLREAKRAEDTWKQKSGSSEDIALLYLALLRAAGLTAYDMKVVNRDRALFALDYLTFNQFDDDVIVLSTGGKEILLDPGEKMCPFQTLHWKHTGAMGVRQSAEGRALSTTPLALYTANTLTRFGSVTLDAHGAVTGNVRLVMNGQEALRWRQFALRNDGDELKKEFDRWLQPMLPEGVEGHLDHFVGLDDPDSQLLAVCEVDGAVGAATSKRLLIPGFFFETRQRQPFVEEAKREEPVDMHYAEQIADEVTYSFPATLTLEGTPPDSKTPWENKAVYVTRCVVESNKVTVANQMLRGFTFAKADEYSGVRDFYQKIAAADQQQLVFTLSTTTAKGN